MTSTITTNGIHTIVGMTNPSTNPNNSTPIILQIISIKSVGSNDNGAQRYRAVLSDGTHFVQGMIATQLNGLVESNELQVNSIIQLKDFMNNNIQGRHVIILLQISILSNPGQRIGAPTDIEKALQQGGGGITKQQVQQPAANALYNRTNTAGTVPTPTPTTSTTSPVKSNPYGSNRSNFGNNRTMNTSNAPIVRSSTTMGGTPITLISQLNMYQNKWTIKARVVSKSDIRTWSNAKGEGSLFSIELLDSSGVDIRATLFKEAVDKFYNFLNVGQIYTVSGGRLKVANVQYNTCKSQLEMTLDQNSEIHLQNDEGDIQQQSFDLIKIADIENIEAGKTIDILAIISDVSDISTVVSRKSGQELTKCEITLLDDTQCQIRLTLWGSQAQSAKNDLQLEKVVAFRKARISDFGGKSLNGGNGIFIEPKIPETTKLQQWYNTQGRNLSTNTKSLSSTGGSSGGRMDPFNDRKHISDIKTQNLGFQNMERGDYLCFKGHFTFLKKDKEGGAWYTACPNKEDPCRNRCKVTQTTDGNWQCDRCHGTYPNCNRKWIFSGTVADESGSTWVSVFDEQAHQILDGAIADDVFEQYDNNQDYYNGLFAKATHTEWIFKCRVKNEMVNDEQRTKTQIVRMDKVDYVSECKDLLSALNAFQ